MESRTQGSRPRPRTQKKIRGQGQGQECSRPRTKDTNASVFVRKKVLKIFSVDFQSSLRVQFKRTFRVLIIGGQVNAKR